MQLKWGYDTCFNNIYKFKKYKLIALKRKNREF